MKLRNIILITGLVLLSSVSCMEQKKAAQEYGYVDISVASSEIEVVSLTKATTDEMVISLDLYNSDNELINSWEDVTEITEPIRLLTGEYKAYAYAGADGGSAAFDMPFYSGSADIVVRANSVVNASLVLTLTNTKVTTTVAEELANNFDYSIEVTNGLASLTFSPENGNLNRTAYFAVTGTLTWTLNLKNNDKETFVVTDTYTGVTENQYYALNFSLEATGEGNIGAGEFRIVVDDSLNSKVHDFVVVIDKSAPSIGGPAEIVKYINDPVSEAICAINSSLPYSSVAVSHSNQALSDAGLPLMTEIYGTDEAAALESAGVAVEILGADGVAQNAIDETTKDVNLNFAQFINKLPIGQYEVIVTSSNSTGKVQTKNIKFVVTTAFASPVLTPWANFVYVRGNWLSSNVPTSIKVQYKKSSSSNWVDFVAQDALQYEVNTSTKTIHAFICGLDGGTRYDVRLTADSDQSSHTSATTEGVAYLPNMGFDDWVQSGDIWYPNASTSNMIWDTANGGTSTIGKYPTEKTTDAVEGNAVKMTSLYIDATVLRTFAAGNVYTGQFSKAIISLTNPGAELDWGVPFIGRPLALTGYYKYSPKAIDKNCNIKNPSKYNEYLNKQDKCQIQVGLFEWSAPFHVNTQTGAMVDFTTKNKTVVAYAKYESDESVPSYKEFVVPFDYRKVGNIPSYVIVTACSSYLGDYFVGGNGSTLYVDEFDFIYDPMDARFAQYRADFFNMFK